MQVLCCHTSSCEVSPPARCPCALPQKPWRGAAHPACCWKEGRGELQGNMESMEPRPVGNLLTNLLVSIRSTPKTFHRGDQSQLWGETFHKEHGNGHWMRPLSIWSVLFCPLTQAFVLDMAHSQPHWHYLGACWSEYSQDPNEPTF